MGIHTGYIEPDKIIADVTAMVGDPEMKVFHYGMYLSQIQQALQDLALNTLFDEQTAIREVPSNGILPLPHGLVNLERVYLFDGNRCENGGGIPVYWARGFTRYVQDFKDQRGDVGDHINDPVISSTTKEEVYYFNIKGTDMHLSKSCNRHQNIMLVFRGIGARLGDTPIVPYELRTAVKNYAAMNLLTIRLAEDPARWREVLNNVKRDHHGGQGAFDVGTWKQAQRYVQNSHIKYRHDLSKYLTAPLVNN